MYDYLPYLYRGRARNQTIFRPIHGLQFWRRRCARNFGSSCGFFKTPSPSVLSGMDAEPMTMKIRTVKSNAKDAQGGKGKAVRGS